MRDVAVAHPFDPTRNVIEIKHIRVQLEGRPLLEKKIVISDITVDSVRGLTRRKTPARPVAAGGFLPGAMREADKWSAQFKVPLLSLTPIDTIRSLILDPSQLLTVQKAKALVTTADSLKDAATARFKSLRLTETADSAQALLARLKGQTPRTLGINGTRTAIADVRRFTARVDSTRRTLDAARVAMRADVDSLVESAKALDEARQADYAFARGLLKLPTFDAPNIGPALFGQVSIDAFERAMYWVMLAREYAPPGILPREQPGPKRLRRSGTTIHFVKQQSLPQFPSQARGVEPRARQRRRGDARRLRAAHRRRHDRSGDCRPADGLLVDAAVDGRGGGVAARRRLARPHQGATDGNDRRPRRRRDASEVRGARGPAASRPGEGRELASLQRRRRRRDRKLDGRVAASDMAARFGAPPSDEYARGSRHTSADRHRDRRRRRGHSRHDQGANPGRFGRTSIGRSPTTSSASPAKRSPRPKRRCASRSMPS